VIKRAVFLHEHDDVFDIRQAGIAGGIVRLDREGLFDKAWPDRQRCQPASRPCRHLQEAPALDVVDLAHIKFQIVG